MERLEKQLDLYREVGRDNKPLVTYVFENNQLLYRTSRDYQMGKHIDIKI